MLPPWWLAGTLLDGVAGAAEGKLLSSLTGLQPLSARREARSAVYSTESVMRKSTLQVVVPYSQGRIQHVPSAPSNAEGQGGPTPWWRS